jgi:predicted secreted protein
LAAKAPLSPTVREITAATDTITSADNGKIIRANRGTGQTLTLDGNIAPGFNCIVIQEDAGQTTFADDEATIINRQAHTKIAGQGGMVSLVCYVANEVILAGDTAA